MMRGRWDDGRFCACAFSDVATMSARLLMDEALLRLTRESRIGTWTRRRYGGSAGLRGYFGVERYAAIH